MTPLERKGNVSWQSLDKLHHRRDDPVGELSSQRRNEDIELSSYISQPKTMQQLLQMEVFQVWGIWILDGKQIRYSSSRHFLHRKKLFHQSPTLHYKTVLEENLSTIPALLRIETCHHLTSPSKSHYLLHINTYFCSLQEDLITNMPNTTEDYCQGHPYNNK